VGPGEVVEVRHNGSPRKTEPYEVERAERWLEGKGYVLVYEGWIDGNGARRRVHRTYERDLEVESPIGAWREAV
jgi:hypothetical protein